MEHSEHSAENTKKGKRFRKIGLIFLIGPLVLMVFVLIGYAVVSYLSIGVGYAGSITLLELIFKIIKFILGFLGLIAVLGFMFGIPLGIIFIVKSKKLKKLTHYDERSGKGDDSEIPEEIRGWNWGAAGLTWIWGAYNEVWISLLSFVPFLGLIFWVVLGVKGNEWAWRKMQWESVEQFKKSQRKWKPWGISFLVLLLALFIVSFFSDIFKESIS